MFETAAQSTLPLDHLPSPRECFSKSLSILTPLHLSWLEASLQQELTCCCQMLPHFSAQFMDALQVPSVISLLSTLAAFGKLKIIIETCERKGI